MTAIGRKIIPSPWRLAALATIAIIAAAIALYSARADAVEYVELCSLYGADFFYIPQTDICLNVTQNDAREDTSGGVWRWRVPNNPRTWANLPQNGCESGATLVSYWN